MRPVLLNALIITIIITTGTALPLIGLLKSEILKNYPATTHNQELILSLKKNIVFPQPSCSIRDQYSALFSLLRHSKTYEQEILDPQTVRDLNLFFYTTQEPEKTVLSCVYHGHSLNGKVALGKEMITPTINTKALYDRQRIIHYLLDNPELAATLTEIFKKFADIEEELYGLWNENDFLYQSALEKLFYPRGMQTYTNWHGAHMLEWHRRINDIRPFLHLIAKEAEQILLEAMISKLNIINDKKEYTFSLPTMNNIRWIQKLWNQTAFNESPGEQLWQNSDLLISAIGLGAIIANIPAWTRSIKNYQRFASYLIQRLSILLKLNTILTEVTTALQSHPTLSAYSPSLNPLLNSLLTAIKRESNNKKGYFFTNIGIVLQLLPRFLQSKHQWSKSFSTLGSLEALLSSAALMRAQPKEQKKWCFASYATSTRPYISITQYTHPMFQSAQAIPNSIMLGRNNSPGCIITGANTAGKTMNLQTITVAALLAQSLGIAPAEYLEMTPFSKILTYLTTSATGNIHNSLFEMEEERILSIVNQLYAIKPPEHSFVAIDELFSGAAPTVGQAAAFGVCYGLATLKNCIAIIATHFKKLSTLPQHTANFYTNYHLKIATPINTDLTIEPFKLVPGVSNQIIAFDLARAAGFDSEIIDSAEDFLVTPHRNFTDPEHD